MKPDYLKKKENQHLFFESLPKLFASQNYTLNKDVYKLLLPYKYLGMAPVKVMNDQFISPLFSDYSSSFCSENYPIGGKILKKISHLPSNYENEIFFFMENKAPFASDLLTSRNFKNLLEDKNISDSEMEEIIRLKTFQFLNYITAFISYDEFQTFLKNYMAHSSFKEIFFQDFLNKLQTQFSLDINDFLIDWYLKDRIPEFRFKDENLQVYKTDKGACYVFSVKVFNPSEEEGILSVQMGSSRSKSFLIGSKNAYLLRVNAFMKRPPVLNKLYTNVSRNIPKSPTFVFNVHHLSETSDTSSGIFKIDTICFSHPANEIIVDNRDPGCIVLQDEERSWLPALFEKKNEQKIEFRPIMPRFARDFSRFWAEDIQNNGYYGEIIKSAYYKVAGKGNCKIEWKANLPQAGLYEVYIYNTRHLLRKETDEQYYTLEHRDGIEKIKLSTGKKTPGWIFIGEFHFNAGETKIILNDKGTPDQRIMADAVKWVKVGE